MTVETNKIHRFCPLEEAHKPRVLYESWSARLVAYSFVFILTLSYALVSDLLLGMSTRAVTLGCVAIAAFLMILSPVVCNRIFHKKNKEVHAQLKSIQGILKNLDKIDRKIGIDREIREAFLKKVREAIIEFDRELRGAKEVREAMLDIERMHRKAVREGMKDMEKDMEKDIERKSREVAKIEVEAGSYDGQIHEREV